MTTTDSRHDATADARPHSPERDASLETVFDALSTRRCRALLDHLAESEDGALVVEDLAARVSATDEDEAQVRTRLHHTDLPKLDERGLLDYDTDRGIVHYRSDDLLEAVRSTVAEFDDADCPIALDALFDLLADVRRRLALCTLLTHGDLSLPDLADEVAVAERGLPLPEIDADAVLGVYLSLYHTHVPKLSSSGLVAYDQDDDYLTLTDTGRALEPTVRALCDPASESKV